MAKKTKGDALVYGSDDEVEDDLDIVSDDEDEEEDNDNENENEEEEDEKAESILDDDPLFDLKGGDNNFFDSESEDGVSDNEFFDSDVEGNSDVDEEDDDTEF